MTVETNISRQVRRNTIRKNAKRIAREERRIACQDIQHEADELAMHLMLDEFRKYGTVVQTKAYNA
jgi:hypothetical protein